VSDHSESLKGISCLFTMWPCLDQKYLFGYAKTQFVIRYAALLLPQTDCKQTANTDFEQK